jgi:CheY-like chemotaxis protein
MPAVLSEVAYRPLVLCVEDNPIIGLMMRHFLALDGCDVEIAATLAGVRERVRRNERADLIVLGTSYPDGTCLDLCRELRADPAWADVPILLVLNSIFENALESARSAGVTDVLTKPFHWEVFRQRVGKLLEEGAVVAAPSANPQAAEPPSEFPSRFPAGTRLLVVDDDELIRMVLKTILETKGCEVLTAANGREGIDIYLHEERRIDAIVLDLRMPVMRGEEALEEFARLASTVPVWLLTASELTEQDALQMSPLVRGVLRKPLSAAAVYKAMVLGVSK